MPTFSIPLSGLTAMSTALSAIANNLANLNTVGYKDTRTLFRDLFYQTIGSSGSGNPVQLGAGVGVSSMPGLFTQGNVDPTGVATDVAINQDGFFIVSKDGAVSYTRAGNFSVDKMMLSVAEVFGPLSMGVIMTGMGRRWIARHAGNCAPGRAHGWSG
jgi:flagellar hook protein FlgE